MKYSSLVILFFFASFLNLTAQGDARELLATVTIKNQNYINIDSIQFDLHIQRNSEAWDRFANATFEIVFADTTQIITKDKYSLSYESNTSELQPGTITGNAPDPLSYHIIPQVRPGRLMIVFSGPELYENCKTIPTDSSLKLGTFILASKDQSRVDINLAFREPWFFFQACAAKLSKDSLIRDQIVYAFTNENLEMDDSSLTYVKYTVEPPKEPLNQVVDFTAYYVGDKRVAIEWRSIQEAYNAGYYLVRGKKAFSDISGARVKFKDTIANYKQNSELIGLGTRNPGRNYAYYYDRVSSRGDEYCYELCYFSYLKNKIIPIDTACLTIPTTIIIEAVADQNPFSSETTIKYKVEEDVTMNCNVYDLNGKLVDKLLENVFIHRNKDNVPWEVTFHASEFAQQGLYEIIFIAKPISVDYIEESRAVVKVQLVR